MFMNCKSIINIIEKYIVCMNSNIIYHKINNLIFNVINCIDKELDEYKKISGKINSIMYKTNVDNVNYKNIILHKNKNKQIIDNIIKKQNKYTDLL